MSKRARKARKQARWAGVLKNVGHPSHCAQNRKMAARVAMAKTDKADWSGVRAS